MDNTLPSLHLQPLFAIVNQSLLILKFQLFMFTLKMVEALIKQFQVIVW
jgi:hypothetical protein